ncbi:MAG: hypothetical protein ABIH23_34505, partial [bacterium]
LMSIRFCLGYTVLSFAFPLFCFGSTSPRSDASVLHADFENYMDGVVQCLNAGVRWLGDPFSNRLEGTVEITRDFAYSGSRCGHVHSASVDQIARIRLQKRYNAPSVKGDSVIEFVFRPICREAVNLNDMTVWEASSPDGKKVGVVLLANGDANRGTYRLDLLHGGCSGSEERVRIDGVAEGHAQSEWVRIIQHRRINAGLVDLWLGSPGSERLVGTYPDLSPGDDFTRAEIGDTSTKHFCGSGYWDDIRVGGLLLSGDVIGQAEAPLRDVGMELPVIESPIPVEREKQLFVDDTLIESAIGLTRTLHPVKKHPANPLVVADKPWEGLSVLLYGAVICDPDMKKFRMWYLAWGKHVDQPSYICYAESEHGLHWTKPNLGLHEFKGSKDNNIIIPNVTSNTTIIYDPHDPDPEGRYKAVIRAGGTHGYLSPDGIHWKDCGVIIDQCYDSTTVHWDPVDHKWIASVKIFRDGKRARGYAESTNFFNWTDTYFMATVDEQDADDDQIYAMIIFRYESVYLGLLRMYHVNSDIVDIQLASSRNARHWDRLIRTPFIPTSPEKGIWDYGNNSPGTDPPIRIGDELWFYYSGRSTTHDEIPNKCAIGLGTLRLDGFVSMDAGDDGGTLVTKPLQLKGGTLCLNADASDGEILVEIIDELGGIIEPYSLENCVAVTADGIRIPVGWNGGENLTGLDGGIIRLRFRLNNADLYAFWME